ncbi:hypothetical protein HD554DRAFT_786849 [Boletus coccyginus]|nr:hypothetical protein HD554DRAFT_786849 [Boletus coccyginus]
MQNGILRGLHTIMEPRTFHILELSAATVCQTILLVAAWGFFGAVFDQDPLIVSDSLATLIFRRPTETTWIVALVATLLSIVTTTVLSIAFKEALRRRMHKPISLIHLSGGIALARNSFLFSFRHLIPTFATLVVFGVTKLLVASWAALLAPSLVPLTVSASGWELDLTSNSFESMLRQELVQSGAAVVRGNSSEIIDLGGLLSGIAAAEYSYSAPGIFSFNGVRYNISTGGILPAAPGYGGITEPASDSGTGLAFAGGLVPTHLDVNFPNGYARQGLYNEFTLQQQGLTANVTCHRTNRSAGEMNLNSSFLPISVPLANGTTDYWLWAWNITGDCGEAQGRPSQQQYVTKSNSSTVPQASMNGFISSLVCPYPLRQTGFSWEHFTVTTSASWKYDFIPLTVCAIDPLVTTSLVSYSHGTINTTVLGSRSLGSNNSNLTQFLAAVIHRQSRTTQGLTTNSIGDALYSIYVSASNNSTNPDDVTNLLLKELEQYWRGVIEFSGTFLRSAFSVYPLTVPTEARIRLTGYETITTMGWYRQEEIWAYTIIPITAVALTMYAAVAYTLWHIFTGRSAEPFTMFDPSNPIHVIMVSSARDPDDSKGNLDDWLRGFEDGGMDNNEELRVQLTNLAQHRKRFRVTQN